MYVFCWCCWLLLLFVHILLFYVLAFVLLKAIYEHNCLFKWQSRDKTRVSKNNNSNKSQRKRWKKEKRDAALESKRENQSSHFILSVHLARTHARTICSNSLPLQCVRTRARLPKNWFPFGMLLTDFIYQFNLLASYHFAFFFLFFFFFCAYVIHFLLSSYVVWMNIFLLMLLNWSSNAFNVQRISTY